MKVVFRKFINTEEIIALFPTQPGNSDPTTCMDYMHIGQHGYCTPGLIAESTELAAPCEYAPLLAELQSIGYTKLIIATKCTYADYLQRCISLDRHTKG